MRTLTHHSTPIVEYDIGRNDQTIVFTASASHGTSTPFAMRLKPFAVAEQSIGPLLQCGFGSRTHQQHYETFISTRSGSVSRKVLEPNRDWLTTPELLSLSPDGRYAIAVRPAGEPPASWDAYTEHVFKDIYLPPARRHPGSPNMIRQYVLIDIRHATARALWDAPQNPFGRVVWSRDSHGVVIGPTFLPVANADTTGLSGRAVAEVDVATGQFLEVPIPSNQPEYGYDPTSWNDDDTIELEDAANWHEDKNRLRFKKTGGVWRPVAEARLCGSSCVRTPTLLRLFMPSKPRAAGTE